MNTSIARGEWQQFRGTLTALWGHVTGDKLSVQAGRHRHLVGKLHAACGQTSHEVGRQIDAVLRRSRAPCERPVP